jgi:hypothetical protein
MPTSSLNKTQMELIYLTLNIRSTSYFIYCLSISQVSVAIRIVPSPDWFVGLDSLELCRNGFWIDAVSIQVRDRDLHCISSNSLAITAWPITFMQFRNPFLRTVFTVKLSCYLQAGAMGESRYSSYSFLTSALHGVSSVTPRPRFTPGKVPPVPTG